MYIIKHIKELQLYHTYKYPIKLGVSEIIIIFTSEDMENMPPEPQMWF